MPWLFKAGGEEVECEHVPQSDYVIIILVYSRGRKWAADQYSADGFLFGDSER